jgi:tRNA wybutosine-synthesizing protein 1
MTPVVDKCSQSCEFCWRVTPADIGTTWDQIEVSKEEVLEPRELMDAVLMANLRSLGGYNPEAGASVSDRKYREAREPKHVAISLAGEPTLYPFLGEFIEEVHNRGMTSFLVTNGLHPSVLGDITLPTQLYVTLAAPDMETHRELCRPSSSNAWNQLQETQELLHSLSCRRANRLTLVEEKNLRSPRDYADLILMGEPDFVEVKGYMFLGSSRGRLGPQNTPSHRAIKSFSEKLSALTGYYLQDEQTQSRVTLLSRSKQIKKIQ